MNQEVTVMTEEIFSCIYKVYMVSDFFILRIKIARAKESVFVFDDKRN